jgi:transcriptional regulator with XRE-family HTH domain
MTMAPTTTRETLADVVSRNIRTLMALRGISQIRLADEVGISQTGVSKRLRGVTPFDLNDLERIAQVLDVRPIDLLNADLLKLPRRDSNLQPAG